MYKSCVGSFSPPSSNTTSNDPAYWFTSGCNPHWTEANHAGIKLYNKCNSRVKSVSIINNTALATNVSIVFAKYVPVSGGFNVSANWSLESVAYVVPTPPYGAYYWDGLPVSFDEDEIYVINAKRDNTGAEQDFTVQVVLEYLE